VRQKAADSVQRSREALASDKAVLHHFRRDWDVRRDIVGREDVIPVSQAWSGRDLPFDPDAASFLAFPHSELVAPFQRKCSHGIN
jgi:hypothetical protein